MNNKKNTRIELDALYEDEYVSLERQSGALKVDDRKNMPTDKTRNDCVMSMNLTDDGIMTLYQLEH